ncbi:M16 family metallopeptidase [Sphingobacterium hungaricum]|uniref:Insulinase family protein n=1 Tax=Sphingobacterium hungaricum TaxID=2082723 RepID=A0A928YTP6_9SPHI|nr:pitrilysin family protein [Sphingobacterium hungaricum]MBE8715348.1 insulinase family protein [Sphingobacterium hungaricum]
MLNRINSPEYKEITGIHLIHPKEYAYGNGLKAFVFASEDHSLIKAEFIFANVFESPENPLLNTALSSLIKEGTTRLTSAEIAEQVDFYGAFLVPEYSYDHTAITVYTLKKYAHKIFPIVKDILMDAIIPEKELQTYIRNNKQTLQVSLEKNDFVARKQFYKSVFGNTLYGITPTKEGLDALTRADLLALYQKQIRPSNCTLILAGAVDQQTLGLIENLFVSDWHSPENQIQLKAPVFEPAVADFIFEERKDSVQSAIRMGYQLINRTDPNYASVQFVNTLFGGFFGSRLMKNIREEKGYTYSIGSAVASLKYSGFFTIATEVGVDVTSATLSEIEKEFSLLRTEIPTEEEVQLVRNYLLGTMLGSLESIFSHADKFKAVYFSGMDLSYYQRYTESIQAMTPAKVKEIAGQYFDYQQLTKVVVGKLD